MSTHQPYRHHEADVVINTRAKLNYPTRCASEFSFPSTANQSSWLAYSPCFRIWLQNVVCVGGANSLFKVNLFRVYLLHVLFESMILRINCFFFLLNSCNTFSIFAINCFRLTRCAASWRCAVTFHHLSGIQRKSRTQGDWRIRPMHSRIRLTTPHHF